MRKLIVAIFVVLLVPFAAQAFTVPEEVQVVGPPTTVTAPAPAAVSTPAPTNDKAYKAIKSLDRKLVGKKGMVRSISEKVNSLVASITGAKTAADNAVSMASEAVQSAEDAKNAVTALDAKLTDKKTGEFKKLNDSVWSAGNQLSEDMKKMAIIAIGTCLVLAIVIIVFIRRSPANVNLQPVEDGIADVQSISEEIRNEMRAGFAAVQTGITELPQRTADAVKAFDPRPIEVTVAGHHAVFTQSAEATAAGVYQYIEVDEDIDPAVTADAYELLVTNDRNRAYDKTRQAIREYYNGSLQKKAAAGSNAAKLKVALVEHYRDTTGQLVVAAV